MKYPVRFNHFSGENLTAEVDVSFTHSLASGASYDIPLLQSKYDELAERLARVEKAINDPRNWWVYQYQEFRCQREH